MELSKKERESLIGRISKASGVAQYALEKKMTNEQVIEAANNLKILSLLKPANNYNRYSQGQKTKEANDKVKDLINTLTDIKNSEIYQTGLWLLNALSQLSQARRQTLLEKDLVDKTDHNQTVIELRNTIDDLRQGLQQQVLEASRTIQDLENTNDSLRKQLALVQNYITSKQGVSNWHQINNYIQNKISKGS